MQTHQEVDTQRKNPEEHTEANHTHCKPQSTAAHPAVNQTAGSYTHEKPLAARMEDPPTPWALHQEQKFYANTVESQPQPEKQPTFYTYLHLNQMMSTHSWITNQMPPVHHIIPFFIEHDEHYTLQDHDTPIP